MLTYEGLGSDADKDAVHIATRSLDKGVFPGAFCFVSPDIAGDDEYCYLKHSDGAGSKVNVAYMAVKEGICPVDVWKWIAQDSLVMNIDDMAAVGAVDGFKLTNCIDRNPLVIGDEVVAKIIEGYVDVISRFSKWSKIEMCGGETADTGNNVRTLVVNSDVSVRMKRRDVIDASNTGPGDVLIGFASYGRSSYEHFYNSGISSNGFTLLTHAMLNGVYKRKYPETFDPNIFESAYSGKFTLDSLVPGLNVTLAEAMLSPTRSYLPLVKKLLEDGGRGIKGIFNCTGGGLTKPIRFGRDVKYVFDDMLGPGHFFTHIIESANISGRELYRTFNMGCRLVVSCSPEVVDSVIRVASGFDIEAKVVGRVENSSRPGFNQVEVLDPVSRDVFYYEKQYVKN